jgi:ABC-type nickel/cobalt efflux system permease component RcnA
MLNLPALIQNGAASAWLFFPSAILLGALHGLEPGHSKTMMAAFIIAVRGTVAQAVLLGLSATISHTAIVWVIALAGLHFGRQWAGGSGEAWLQLASAALIIAIALWMIFRTWSANRPRDHDHAHAEASAVDHDHGPRDVAEAGMDAHERAHARDIARRFTDRHVTTAQIVLFGLTGGLIPCPAAITVLLLCLQLRQFSLGAGLVLCFSIGLAVTMVAVGVVAALSLRHVERRFAGLSEIAARAPYLSGALIILVGLYTGWLGWSGLTAAGA